MRLRSRGVRYGAVSLLFVAVPFSSVHAAITDGLVSFWQLDESSGARLDSVGDNDLSVSGSAIGNASGKIDSAAQFQNGSTGYLTVANNSTFNVSGGDFSLSAWVYLDNRTGTQVFVSKYSTSGFALYYEPIYPAFVFATYAGGTGIAQGTVLGQPNTGTWYHIVGVHDAAADTNTIRINDQYANTKTSVTDQPDTTAAFLIGAFGGSGQYIPNGRIDAVGFWNRKLTSGEITQLYNSGNGIELSGSSDGIAPLVELTAPADGATVSGTSVTISASSTDETSHGGVRFYVNGVAQGSEDTSPPYSITWDSTATSSGSKTIVAVARDAANNYATSSARTITVSNTIVAQTPSATPTSNGASISWTTDQPGSTRLFFGLLDPVATSTTETNTGGSMTTSHSVSLSDLPSCVVYRYQTVNKIGVETATSTERTFNTACTGSAAISTTTTKNITSAVGGTLLHGGITMTIPSGVTATSSAVIFQAATLDADAVTDAVGTPEGKDRVGDIFHLKAVYNQTRTLDQFAKSATVTISYAGIDEVDEDSLFIGKYESGSWQRMYSTVDTVAKTVTATTSAVAAGGGGGGPILSDWGIFGDVIVAESGSSGGSSATSGGGASIQMRVKNLIESGNLAYAQQLMREYPQAFAASAGATLPGSPLRAAPVNCSSYRFARTLMRGMNGDDVRELQRFLNCHGFTIASEGPGSPGNESIFFAQRTMDAVMRFQEAYAEEILRPSGLTKGSGHFGRHSQKKAYALMGIE